MSITERPIRNPTWSSDAVVQHFGDHGPHAEFYRMLRAADRDLFLNSGYSRFGRRHWSLKSQVRLVDRMASRLFRRGPRPIRLLDVGSGRGGPATRALRQWDADVTGIDICPYSVDRAIEQTRSELIHEGLRFRGGDGMNLPFPESAFPYIWSIESAAYMPDKRRFFEGVARVLQPGGRFGMAAICIDEPVVAASPQALDAAGRFLRAWDMPLIGSIESYTDLLGVSGLPVYRREDVTKRTLRRHAVRLRRLMHLWQYPLGYRLCARFVRNKTGADLDAMREQLEATCVAIETGALRYGLFWAEKPSG